MKYNYTPKTNKFAKTQLNTTRYTSDAIKLFTKKARSEVVALITEINRRTSENYHLN